MMRIVDSAFDRVQEGGQARQRKGRLPLSFVQRQLWFLNELEGGCGSAYNVSYAVRIEGELHIGMLRRALDDIFARHEILSVRIDSKQGEPVHVVTDRSEFPFEEIREDATSGDATALQDRLTSLSERPFDLSSGPLCRATLIHLTDGAFVLLISFHHIITDGWSIGLFRRELSSVYKDLVEGKTPSVTSPEVQYIDYALEEQALEGAPSQVTALDYWTERLKDCEYVLELPGDRPRPEIPSFRGRTVPFTIGSNIFDRLVDLNRRSGTTLYMTLLAAFDVLLYKYTSRDDVLVGTPFANRNRVSLNETIGFFVNTLPIRTDLSGNPTFQELLVRVRDEMFNTFENVNFPMERLISRLRVPVDLSRNPLFQVAFALQNAPAGEIRFTGADVAFVPFEQGGSKFDLMLNVRTGSGHLNCQFDYSTDLFEETTIRRMIGHFGRILEVVVARPDIPISDLDILTGEEREQIIGAWNDSDRVYPRDSTISDLFEEVVAQYPDRTALRTGDSTLSYSALNQRADEVARILAASGVGPDTLVGLYAERSPQLIIGILAIVKAGGAYVPLDPSDPVDRISFIVEDAGLELILKQGGADGLPALKNVSVIDLEELPTSFNPTPGKVPSKSSASDLAYMIYTSGSTGKPKGVLVEQRGVVRLVKNPDYILIDPSDTFLMLAPTTFDVSTFEIWAPLLNGATLSIAPAGKLSLKQIGSTVKELDVSTLWLTSGLFNLMVEERLEDLSGLRYLLVGGDVVSPSAARKAKKALGRATLINGYGPTECTTIATTHVIDDDACRKSRIPIGRPISNTTAFVLDRDGNPCPIGIPGELYLGGDGVARGYRGRPGLTKERFIINPLSDGEGGSLYRTGDRCRWLEDGTIDFLGRFDDQIKLRGFRVEPSEIEFALERHENVESAIVIGVEDATAQKALVAYLTVKEVGRFEESDMAAYLERRMPSFMIPSAIVRIDEIPRTSNGKIDRGALENPLLGKSDVESPSVNAELSENERVLHGIWCDVLGLNSVSVDDNFFYLGGHSLLAMKVVARLEKQFGIDFSVKSIFERPTLSGLASVIDEAIESRADKNS